LSLFFTSFKENGGMEDMRKAKLITIFLASLAVSSNASAVIFGGVDFPDGATSFADSVVNYSPGSDVGAGWDDPSKALGIPDYTGLTNQAVSLGEGGSLTLRFTDNSLTTSGDATADLWIFEIGGATESFNVQISTDNLTYIDLGNISGQPSGIDIDFFIGSGVTLGALYSYVLLTDVLPNQSVFPFGEADIDAVGAISSAPPVNPVPIPAALWLFGTALIGLVGFSKRRKTV
jgi:hypothetical protein